jgi:hypothetical protein
MMAIGVADDPASIPGARWCSAASPWRRGPTGSAIPVCRHLTGLLAALTWVIDFMAAPPAPARRRERMGSRWRVGTIAGIFTTSSD